MTETDKLIDQILAGAAAQEKLREFRLLSEREQEFFIVLASYMMDSKPGDLLSLVQK